MKMINIFTHRDSCQSYTIILNWVTLRRGNYLKHDEFINYLRGTQNSTLCRNEVFSFTHWSLRSTKRQCAIHSHVFHLYSTGGNGGASDVSCWHAPKNLFYFSVVVPVRWISPLFDLPGDWSECVLRICQHPRSTLFSEKNRRRALADTTFIPFANKKSHFRVNSRCAFEIKDSTVKSSYDCKLYINKLVFPLDGGNITPSLYLSE